MMLKQVLGACVFALGVAAALSGCGSSDDSAASGGAAGAAGAAEGGEAGALAGGGGGLAEGGAAGEVGEGGAAGTPALNPPSSIDLKLCDATTPTPASCINCCYDGGFLTSTIYDDKCVCGTPSDNPDVCGSSAAANCFSCCNKAGYASANFTFSDPTQCSCGGKFDAKVCAASAKASDPQSACHVCCLNDGYLHSDYDGTGTPSCTCGS